MTDPTTPRARGRHSQPDARPDARPDGRPAADLLAAWGTAGPATLQAEEPAGPRPRRRRYAPDTDASGVPATGPRGPVDATDVGITGLDASGMADLGLAAAGLDLSAFGIGAHPSAPVPGLPGRPRSGAVPAGSAPRTTEMAVAPPAVPHLDDPRAGQPAARRSAPAPRRATEPRTADRVAADRWASGDTDPGWLTGPARPVPQAADAAGSLAALFDAAPAGATTASRPADELATEVQSVPSTAELRRREEEESAARWALVARHRTDEDDDDLPHEHEHEHEDGADGEPDPATGLVTMGDRTGGLEVLGAGDHHDEHHDDGHHDDDHHDDHDDDLHGGGGGGRGRRGGRGGSGRRRRGPITLVLSFLVLAALIAGIGVGGLTLYRKVNPLAEDYPGAGTGTVDVRVEEGDSLRAIGGTLVTAGVIASADPFEDAAKANPAATGIQPGVYQLRKQMSGQAALDLLLDPASRQLTKVTLPEGLTVQQTLQRLADKGGLPLDQLQAAAADPVALGLPPYANGVLEGFLFPATYDVDPDSTPVDVLRAMVARTDQVLTDLQVPVEQRLTVLTKASIVQAEAGSVEDMGKVARVLENRLSDGMPLQLDTTVNYANGKSGLTTTAQDRANPSPYNTYVHPGLPPGAISNPGEEAVRAVLAPTPGDWRFFVVVNPDTGETRFAVTAEEHQQNVLLFQQWLQENPGN